MIRRWIFAPVGMVALCLGTATNAEVATLPEGFEGRYIAAISDGDMRAYAYIDGELGAPRGADQLTVVPITRAETSPRAIEVSNSVINPVYSIDASPDGNTIFVAETRLPRDEDDAMLWDLGIGTTLRAISVGEDGTLTLIDEIEVGTEPQGVSVSPDGRTLVLATKTPETPLSFVSFENDQFGALTQFALEGLTPIPELLDQGMFPHHAEWHPTEDVVALTFNFRGQVRFYQVERNANGAVTGISQWGNAVQTSKWPMSGKFSADGRFFVSNDLQWGADVAGFYLNAPPSQLTSIRLAALDAEEPQHIVVGGVSLPRHAESIAFSNAGDLIGTVNIGQTWNEPDAVGYSLSSLSLVGFDVETGQFDHYGDWTFDAILPEGIDFDASDDFVVVGAYEYEGPEPRESALEIWEVIRTDGGPGLADTGMRIPTGPGAHSLIVVD
ncbi:hypothetical protein [Cognatiyoonia sp. IB215182]|uniref:hypothetical protein n=1 Tax=Cognatiyoonia sp. IB215182 TaxID=3097353 RepID=UPI002A110B20|nr:hypothetical protein [Cognatiyoonia sp. IB215182]MDX8355028.1 hypothetical protein [Cognatiyoonia sp. IB215182]